MIILKVCLTSIKKNAMKKKKKEKEKEMIG